MTWLATLPGVTCACTHCLLITKLSFSTTKNIFWIGTTIGSYKVVSHQQRPGHGPLDTEMSIVKKGTAQFASWKTKMGSCLVSGKVNTVRWVPKKRENKSDGLDKISAQREVNNVKRRAHLEFVGLLQWNGRNCPLVLLSSRHLIHLGHFSDGPTSCVCGPSLCIALHIFSYRLHQHFGYTALTSFLLSTFAFKEKTFQ